MEKKDVVGFILLVGCILAFTQCKDKDYVDLIEENKTEIAYIGIRENQEIVSNKYAERNLTELGLSKDAEFLYGNNTTMFFAEKGSSKVTIKSYNFVEELLQTCCELQYGNLRYVAMASDDAFFCFYFQNSAWKVDRCTLNGGQKNIPDFSNHSSLTETEQKNIVRKIMDEQRTYKWSYQYFDFYNGYYALEAYKEVWDMDNITISDPVWEFLNEKSGIDSWICPDCKEVWISRELVTKTINEEESSTTIDNCCPNCEVACEFHGKTYRITGKRYEANQKSGQAVFARNYHSTQNLIASMTDYTNYFVYTHGETEEESTIEFLFAEKENAKAITGLYVLSEENN